MNKNSPIGVFDSGVGGLTVMREIINELPNESIIYFGDTARVPYGAKSKETILKYSKQISNFLIEQNVKTIVVACGTASSNCAKILENEYDIKIIEVITPASIVSANTTKNNKIGVIGTESTIKSKAHENMIKTINNDIQIINKACPLFVPLVEEGWIDTDVTYNVCNIYLKELIEEKIDTIILGCTHYPLLYDVIKKIVGDINIVDPARETAKVLKFYLKENDLLSNGNNYYKLFSSDYGDKFDYTCRQIINNISNIEEVIATRKKINIDEY